MTSTTNSIYVFKNITFDLSKITGKSGSLKGYFNHQEDRWHRHNIHQLYLDIMKSTSFLEINASISQRIYHIKNNLIEIPKCLNCFNETNFESSNKFYQECCSRSCAAQYQMKQPGSNSHWNSAEMIFKSKSTKLEKYGSATYNNRSQTIKTCLEKYDVENISQCQIVKDKKSLRDTPEAKIQRRNQREYTMFEKYGVRHAMHVPEIFNKVLKSRYKHKTYTFKTGESIDVIGYEHIALKKLESDGYLFEEIEYSPNRIEYIHEGKLRYYTPDFYIKSENRYIEIKSTYTIKCDREVNTLKFNSIAKHCNLEIWIIIDFKPVAQYHIFNWLESSTIDDIIQIFDR